MSQSSRRNFLSGALLYVPFASLLKVSNDPSPPPFQVGVNLAHAEFSATAKGWSWPNDANIEYYLEAGIRIFRIPFLWERIQPNTESELDDGAVEGLDHVVNKVLIRGGTVILDSHNYGRRDGRVIAEESMLYDKFVTFWSLLAKRYGKKPAVWFGLMNEPHNQGGIKNIQLQNSCAGAIRAAGGQGWILFSGIAWSGAHSWVKSGNASFGLMAEDPLNRSAFDVHQYFDPGYSGSSTKVVPGVGKSSLQEVYIWAKLNRMHLFVGEFASGTSSEALDELRDFLRFMQNRTDVFIGATYWAGGGGWGSNEMTSDPGGASKKPRPQLSLIIACNRGHKP